VKLSDLGWNEDWQRKFEPYTAEGLAPARIIAEHKELYRVATDIAELSAEVSGKLRFEAVKRSDFPAVGDFVALRLPDGDGSALIHAILPRWTAFIRKAAGESGDDQVVAANVDAVFIMTAMDHDFNMRRLERYLTLVWDGGARPVVLLNKADLCEDPDALLDEISNVAFGVPVHIISALTGEGLAELEQYLRPGLTVSFVGSSGVGKSTLLNHLLGRQAQATQEVRAEDSRGRHTTTHRELFVRPEGGIIIDTPGMRELQLLNAQEGIEKTFSEIDALAAQCRFHDCQHGNEPGCAVREAVKRGELDPERLASFNKLTKELRYTETRYDKNAALERKRTDKIANKAMKHYKTRN
jgi:ribosome biogenesis GTPase